MIKQDYLLRMIAMLAEVLANLATLRKQGKNVEAQAIVDEQFMKLIGLEAKFLDSLALGDLVGLLRPSIGLDASRALAAADLFYEQGHIRAAQGDEVGAFASHVKSLTLYLEVFTMPGSIDLPDRAAKAEELIESIGEYELPAPTETRLFQYFEKTNRYAAAEDLLFDRLDANEDDDAFRDLGRAFYERLLLKSDADLEAGGLPRDEAQDGLAKLLADADVEDAEDEAADGR
jgi:hypothetical protein